jgi:hypothetical protein
MNVADIAVLLGSGAALAGLGWFFFAPRRALSAQLDGGVQRAEVVVRGGYRPDVIRVRQGVPVEIVFDRQESGDCTSRVVFGDFAVSAALPAFARSTVRLDPVRAGSFGFACGMNMVHGTLLVEPADEHAGASAVQPVGDGPGPDVSGPEPSAVEVEAAQAAERKTEIVDLTRRVLVGAVLTAPVAVFLALAVAALTSPNLHLVRAALLVMQPVTWYVLVPLAFASLLSGLVSSLGSPWGLLRHYWVVFKLLLNIGANIILLLYTQTVAHLAAAAADPATPTSDLLDLARSPVLHATAALMLLIVATILAVYKPRGVTGYGQRLRQRTARGT